MPSTSSISSLGDRMRGLRLSAMAEHWERQEAALDERPFAERMAELLGAQEAHRAGTVLHKGARQAQSFVSSARWKDLVFKPGRGLSPSAVEALKSWQWLKQKRHLLLTGDTGRGKTWLASAVANEALMAGYKVRCFNVVDFLQQFYEEEQAGRIFRFVAELTRADLVVLDRWAHHPLDAHGVARLEELVLKRDGRASLVVCSSRPVVEWENWLGGGPVAQGVVDRLVSRANLLELKGPSLRNYTEIWGLLGETNMQATTATSETRTDFLAIPKMNWIWILQAVQEQLTKLKCYGEL